MENLLAKGSLRDGPPAAVFRWRSAPWGMLADSCGGAL